MGECHTCVVSLQPSIVWGRYACECGKDFCSNHASKHEFDTGHKVLDKQSLLNGLERVLGGGPFRK